MDISRANSEPFLAFHRAREAMDRTIKVTTGALVDVQRRAKNDNGTLIKELVSKAGEPWGDRFTLKSSSETLEETLRHLSGLWIAQIFSLFHLYVDEAIGELSRWRAIGGQTLSGRRTDDEGNLSFHSIYSMVGATKEGIAQFLPAFRYFELIRNCAAHRGLIASPALAAFNLEELDASLASLPRRATPTGTRRTPLPALPAITPGRVIPLMPRHSVLGTYVCYSVAADINRKLVEALGVAGLVYMAAQHSVLSDGHPARSAVHKNPQEAINTFLNDRFRVKLESNSECIRELKRIGKWHVVVDKFKQNSLMRIAT